MRIYAFADEASPAIDGQIAAMRRNGLNGLEIRGVDGENVSAISLEKAKEVRRKLDDAGLCIWSIGSPIGKIDIETGDFAAHLEQLRHTLEVAQVLGAKRLRMFSFYIPAGKDPADYRNQLIAQLMQVKADGWIEEYGLETLDAYDQIDPAAFREKVVSLQAAVQQEIDAIMAQQEEQSTDSSDSSAASSQEG